MIAPLLLRAGGGAVLGFTAGVLIGGRLGMWISPAGEHDVLAFAARWGLPLVLAPAGLLGAILLMLSGFTTRMARGLIGSVAGDGSHESRRIAAGALGAQLHRTLGRPVILMRLTGWGLLGLLVAGGILAALG